MIKSRIPVAGRGSIYHLKVTPAEVKPQIWRRLRVPGEANLGWLHAVIQVAMGWTNSHLHQFTFEGTVYSDPSFELDEFENDPKVFDESQAKLQNIAPKLKSVLLYEYDFGDSWDHFITVEKFCLPIRRWRAVRNAQMAHAPARRRIAGACAATRTSSKFCVIRTMRNTSRCCAGWAALLRPKSSTGTGPTSICGCSGGPTRQRANLLAFSCDGTDSRNNEEMKRRRKFELLLADIRDARADVARDCTYGDLSNAIWELVRFENELARDIGKVQELMAVARAMRTQPAQAVPSPGRGS